MSRDELSVAEAIIQQEELFLDEAIQPAHYAIQYNAQNGYYATGIRFDFRNTTKQHFQPLLQPGEAICHLLSYSDIRFYLIATLNEAGWTPTQKRTNLNNLIYTVYWGDETSQAYGQALDYAQHMKNNIATIATVLQDVNDLLDNLNSSIFNLRRGAQNWNGSIGASLDPREWYYADAAGTVRGGYQNLVAAAVCPHPIPAGHAGYYLTAPEMRELSGLLDVVQPDGVVSIFTAQGAAGGSYAGIKFIYSSLNPQNQFIPTGSAQGCAEPIYFWDGAHWQSFT